MILRKNGQELKISTKVSVHPKYWNKKTLSFRLVGKEWTFRELRYKLTGEEPEQIKDQTFIGFFVRFIKSKVNIRTHNTIVSVQFEDDSRMTVSQNPVLTGSIKLNFFSSNFESGELSIFDSVGRLIQSQTILNRNIEIQTENFPKGIYWVQLEVNGKRFLERVVVQ